MDFSKVNKKDLITDLVKIACFNIVANILMNMRYGEPLLSERFIYSLAFILIGFATYHIFLAPQLIPRI
jgi:hypothetical protein